MHRLAPVLRFIFVTVVLAIAVTLLSDEVKPWIAHPRNFLLAVVGATAVGMLTWWAHRASQRRALENEFGLFKLSDQLCPEDLNFKTAKVGEYVVSGDRRPHYPTYIPRVAVPHAQRLLDRQDIQFSERDLAAALAEGESVLLIGMPTEGKTRTLFEVVRSLSGFVVVRPRSESRPSESALALIANRNVICLFDDINAYASSPTQLIDFYRSVASRAARCAIAGACRNGPELDAVTSNRGSSLFQVYEVIRHRLALRAPTDDERSLLKTEMKDLGDAQATTLGSICLRGTYDLMWTRFDGLSDSTKEVHQAMQLLATANVEPLTHQRVRHTVAAVFGRSLEAAEVRDALGQLAANDFLLSSRSADPIVGEAAYLQGPESAKFYKEGTTPPTDDLEMLIEPLRALGDENALAQVAWTLGEMERPESAVLCYRTLIEHCLGPTGSNHPVEVLFAMFNMAGQFSALGQTDQEMRTYDEIEARYGADERKALQYVVGRALLNKGIRLRDMGNPAAALDCADLVLSRTQGLDMPILDSLVAKAMTERLRALIDLDRPDDEVRACDELVERFGSHADPEVLGSVGLGLLNNAIRLRLLGRSEECIQRFDQIASLFADTSSVALRIRAAEALWGKGKRLEALGRDAEARAAYQEVLSRYGGATESELVEWVANAEARLADFAGTTDEAVALYGSVASRVAGLSSDEARRIHAEALYCRAVVLRDLGRRGEAILAYAQVAERHAQDASPDIRLTVTKAMRNQGVLLDDGEEHGRAEALFHLVLGRWNENDGAELCDQVARAHHNLAAVFLRRGQMVEAIEWLRTCFVRFSNSPSPAVREQAARAGLTQGRLLAGTQQREQALAVYDATLALFPAGDSTMPRDTVFKLLRNKSLLLGLLERHEERLPVLEELEARMASWGEEATNDRRIELLMARNMAATELGDEAVLAVARQALSEEILLSGRTNDETSNYLKEAFEMGI